MKRFPFAKNCMTLEVGTVKLLRNAGKKLPFYVPSHPQKNTSAVYVFVPCALVPCRNVTPFRLAHVKAVRTVTTT